MGHPITIHDLPIELLFSIFRLSFAVTTFQRDRCRLALVCRLWRDIVQESPYLWTEISGHDTVPYIRRSFVKSGDLPIDVYYLEPRANCTKTLLSEYLKEVLPHFPRFRSINLQYFGSLDMMIKQIIVELHSIPVPYLEAFTLKSSSQQRGGYVTESNVLQLPGMSAFPKLRLLEIDGVACELSPPGLLLNNVLSLNLVEVLSITVEQLLEVLQNSPSLERLELGRSPTTCPSRGIAAPIHLPHLTALHLIFMPISVSNLLLTAVHAPNCSELVISSHFPESPDDPVRDRLFTSDTQHFRPVLHTLSNRGRYKDIKITRLRARRVEFLLKFRDEYSDDPLDRGVLRLRFILRSVKQVEQALHWLVDCRGTDTPKISIRLFLNSFEEAHWMDIFDSSMSVTHFALCLRSDADAIRPNPILVHMAQPTLSHWPLHEMEDFIYGVAGVDKIQDEAVLAMLQNRYGCGESNLRASSGEPSNGISYPKPLRRFRIAEVGATSDYVLDEVQKILPAADISLFEGPSIW